MSVLGMKKFFVPNSQLRTQDSELLQRERGQVILRHTELTAYRCFLPDLAGFTGFCCTGPSPYLSLGVRSQGAFVKKKLSYPFTLHIFIWRRGWAFKVARAKTARAPTEGASPLVCSPRRGHIPRDPPLFESHPRCFHALPHSYPLRFTPHVSRLHMAERVGFEPTVPLLGRMLSKHVDSTTLAPLRTDFREAAS